MKRIELYNDSFQNFRGYQLPKAQLIIADVPYCYDKETECWTKEGWKRYDEITMDDVVLSLNHLTQEMEYSRIKNIIIRQNTEDMYRFKTIDMDLFVSAKHRLYANHCYTTRTKNC